MSAARRCADCRYNDYSVNAEPCNYCYGKLGKPYFEENKGVDKAGTAEAKKRCRDCKYSNVSLDREPCFSCLFDEGKPNFRERCEDTEGNATRSEILTEANNIVSGHRKAGNNAGQRKSGNNLDHRTSTSLTQKASIWRGMSLS